jgi:uncharacterized linocin/CFP29 family protein
MAEAQMNSGGNLFGNSAGRWAAEQLAKGKKKHGKFTVNSLRTLDTLERDEWIYYDDAVVEETAIRLRAVADLIRLGLVTEIPNAIGKTLIQVEQIGDMQPAIVSMSGLVRADNDGIEPAYANTPLPIIHKDFRLDLRHLEASRERNEPLDALQARVSTRLVNEKMEYLTFNGGPTFAGNAIYGLLTHPSRNTGSFGTNGAWSAAAKTGADMQADLVTAIKGLQADRMYGPYGVYVPGDAMVGLDNDFKAASDRTIRERLLAMENIAFINSSDQLPTANLVVVQLTPDVITWGRGLDPTTVQWDIQGGFGVDMKIFAIGVPIIRADKQGRSGIYHMS